MVSERVTCMSRKNMRNSKSLILPGVNIINESFGNNFDTSKTYGGSGYGKSRRETSFDTMKFYKM